MARSRFGSRRLSHHTSTSPKRLSAVFDVARLVVHHHVGAQLAADLDLILIAGRGHDAGADGPRHLHDARSDSARAAVHEEFLAHLQLGIAEKAEVGRDSHQGNGRGVLERHFLGNGIQPLFFNGRELGKGALAAQEALVASPHTVPRLQPLDLGANRVDNAGQITTQNERLGQFHRHGARTNIRVNGIDRHCLDLDKDLGARRFWLG